MEVSWRLSAGDGLVLGGRAGWILSLVLGWEGGLATGAVSGGVVHVPAFGESRGSCSISTPQ